MQFEKINLKFPKFTTLGGPPKQFEITRKRTHSELIENSERLRETHRCSLTLIERSRCLKSPSTSQLRNLQKIFESSNLNQQSYFDSWQVCLYSKLPVLLFYLCSLCPCNIKVINISFDMFRCNKEIRRTMSIVKKISFQILLVNRRLKILVIIQSVYSFVLLFEWHHNNLDKSMCCNRFS
jgi:hypothetical protein